MDAVNIYHISKKDSDLTAIPSMLKYYVQDGCVGRFIQFISNRFVNSSNVQNITEQILENNENMDILGTGILAYFISQNTNLNYLTDFVGDESYIATGFTNKLIDFLNSEG